MTEERKDKLRRRYLRAQAVINYELDRNSCGLTLLRFISPVVDEACCEIELIKVEVKQAMVAEKQGVK